MKVAVTILVSCVAALLALGMVMLYSSSMAQVGARYLMMQLVWCVLGLAACVAATLVDYRRLKKVWWVLFGLAVLMLVLVLNQHIGVGINGARRWFSFGGMHFQPSEFAKIALIIALAWYGEHFQRQMPLWKRGILIPGLLIGLAVGLIFKEPDVGNALVLAAVSGILLLISGIRLRYFLPPVIAAAIGIGVFIYHNPMRSERIYSWLHVEETRRDKGLQAYQAMVALGSGGLTGKGLGDGRQKLGFVPEHHTDFIFSIIGEELGLIATLLVIVGLCRDCLLRHLHCDERGRHLRPAARLGDHVSDWLAGVHQHRCGHQRLAEQGPAAAVHQLRRIQPADDARERRASAQHRPAGARDRTGSCGTC